MPHIEKQINTRIGANIKTRRKEFGVSQKILGEFIGVSYQQVQKYEIGRNGILASRLYRIAKFLKKPIEYFFKWNKIVAQRKKSIIDK